MSERVVLITGIAGGLAQLVGERLHALGYEIVGVDYRREPHLDFPATIYRASYNKTKIEDIIRRHRPTHVLHLGRVGNLKEQLGKRFDLNVLGSRKVMDLAARYGARRLLVLSTFHIYGAHPHNHIPIFEDEPLRAGTGFPQIADAIQLDNQAVLWMYRHAECRTAILRPCNVVGPDVGNAISGYLRSDPVPVILGFDPMVQLIHQDDLVEALVRVTEGRATGIFNVVGKGTIPLRDALRVGGGHQIPVPSSVAMGVLKLAQVVGAALPPYLVNFLKYPCIISDEAIRETFNWAPRVDQREAVRSTIEGARHVDAPPGAR
ncbi:MAG: NAD-dependent epimerase/dehydratase family protein [Deltaproteobacteria bacterium]|nr:NAD-dependent epimerase/dehydratase family protein [Deltaproteobacteria bacterium]